MRSPRWIDRNLLPTLLGALLLVVAVPTAEARMTLKMATLVPAGSVWDNALQEMGADWQDATDGEVSLRIYGGGRAGDEPDMVRKMRIGQLHAGALTTGGLTQIDKGFEVFEIPMFFESYAELNHVLEKLRPELEKRLEAKGFVLLHWGHGGWVHLFSKDPVRQVDDLKQQKLFVSAGSDALVQLWLGNGFQPVALATTDIMTGLQTGMIEALPTTPLAALSLQWYSQTPYMQDIGLAPLVGATVVTKKAWDRISPEHQKKIRQSALRTERQLAGEIPAQDEDAVQQMKGRGLKVVDVDDATLVQWRQAADEFTQLKRKTMDAKDLLDMAQRERDAFRAAAKGSAP